jgi:hypothetical protein
MSTNADCDPYEQLRADVLHAISYLCTSSDNNKLAAPLRVAAQLTGALRVYEDFRARHVGGLGGRLELHRYAGRPADPDADAIAAKAREQYGTNEVEIEDPPFVSESGDGAWVMAWVWLGNDEEATSGD